MELGVQVRGTLPPITGKPHLNPSFTFLTTVSPSRLRDRYKHSKKARLLSDLFELLVLSVLMRLGRS